MSRRWLIAAGFLALSGAFWLSFAFGRRALFYDILFAMDYPNAAFLRESLARGVLPFWNPRLYSGVPFLANIQAAVFYPATWLFALLPFPTAAALSVWLHAALAACGMRLLLRQKGASQEAAALAGVIYGFNGFAVGHYAYLENAAAYAWLPLLVWLLVRAARTGSRRDALAAGLAGALEILAGHPQFALYTAAAAAAYLLWEERSRKAAATLVLAGAASLAFSAAQWLPTLSFARQSTRLASPSYAFAAQYSLRPLELLRMLLQPLWSWSWAPQSGDPRIVGFYVGLPALALALAGLRAGRRAAAFAGLAAFAALAALGSFGPVFPALYRLLTPLRWLRFPAQALCVCAFGLAGLAALGLDSLRLSRRAAWLVAAAVAADLWLFSRRAVATIDPAFYAAREPIPDFLRKAAGQDYRFLLSPRSRDRTDRSGPTELAAWLGFRDSLSPNLAAAEGLLDAWGRQELRYAAYDDILAALSKNPHSPWMDGLSVRYVLTFGSLPAPKFRLVRSGSLNVYENEDALPRAYFCPRAISVPTGGEQAYLDAHPEFRFRDALLRQGPDEGGPAAGSARLWADGGNALRIAAQASAPGWVVVADAYDPGWTATVDGRPAAVERVNAFQRAVRVPAGTSFIQMRYRPPLWRSGAAVSAGSLAAGLFWAL